MFHFEFIVLSFVAPSNLLDLGDSSHLLLEFLVLGLSFLLQRISLISYLTYIFTQVLHLALEGCGQITGP